MAAGLILLAGVFKPLEGDPVPISHSEAMTVVDRTFVLRGIWVLMRRFSVPIVPPLESASAKLVL